MNPGRLSGIRIRIPLVIIGVLFLAVLLFVVFAPGTRRTFVIPEFRATGIESIEFSSDGRFLAMIPMTGDFASVWGVAPHGSLRRTRLLRLSGWRPTCSAFFPSNGTVAIGCHRDTGNRGESEGESAIVVFDLSSQSVRGTWRFFRGQVSAIDVSPDAQAVAAGTRAGVVTLWRTGREDVEECDFSELADAHSHGVNCVKFSPTGDALAVAVDSTALLVDPLTLEVRHTLIGHGVPTAYPVNDLDFSDDARDLASIGNDGTTRIWDTLSGLEKMVLHEGYAEGRFVKFDGSNRTLLTFGALYVPGGEWGEGDKLLGSLAMWRLDDPPVRMQVLEPSDDLVEIAASRGLSDVAVVFVRSGDTIITMHDLSEYSR